VLQKTGQNFTTHQTNASAPGLPDGIFLIQNPSLGKSWRVLQWKMLVYVIATLSILLPFGIFCCHLVYFMFIWYIFPRFGILCQEKSGNPALCLCAREHFPKNAF
jgi:hypothetical protein